MTQTKTVATALPVVNARIYPRGGLDILSRDEVARLRDASSGGMHDLLRSCALAVLTSGSTSDDPRAAQELYPDFEIEVLQQDRGVRIDLTRAPAMAFVDGEIIRGVAELLFAVVRDLAYTAIELGPEYAEDLETSSGLTNAVFGLLRNARILQPSEPNLVVCWGGHSISRDEYEYTKLVGYELGLRSEYLPGLTTSLALWTLNFNSELVYVGDAGATEASRPSKRRGIEWNNRWAPLPWLLVDADLAWTHARFSDADPVGDRIPNSIDKVASIVLTARELGPWTASLQWRYLGSGASGWPQGASR